MEQIIEIIKTIASIIGACATAFAAAVAIIKPLRKKIIEYINKKKLNKEKLTNLEKGYETIALLFEDMADMTDDMASIKKEFKKSQNEIKQEFSEKITNMKIEISKDIDSKLSEINSCIAKQEERLKKNDDCTILSLRYQILNLCRRATRYKGLIYSDRTLLYELYEQYHNKMGQNHYIEDEFEKAVALPELNKYEETN